MENIKFVGIISGEKVHNGFVVIGIVDTITDSHKLVNKANEQFNITFVKDEYHSSPHWHVYRNITDDRDITLTIEVVLKL